MKQLVLIGVALMLFVSSAQAEEWFDLQGCEICKTMTSQEGLMQNIQWETKMIPHGSLSIVIIPTEHKVSMEKAHQEMEKVIARLEDGEAMHLCGHCKSYGELMEMGVERTELETIGGKITLMTSDDSNTVKKIQAHAKKSTDEFKKMLESAPAS